LADFVGEVLRVHERFLVEVVEAHGLCPWAEGARTTGALRRAVILDEHDALPQVLALDDKVIVAILIYPRFRGGVAEFEALVQRLRAREEAARGERSPFVTALFHPALKFSTDTPQQLLTLFRRSPDPSLQLVRYASLQSVRSAAPDGKFLFTGGIEALAELERRLSTIPVSERIARDNAATVASVGLDRILALLDDIRADRDRSYGEK
jgi:hypothetical protein